MLLYILIITFVACIGLQIYSISKIQTLLRETKTVIRCRRDLLAVNPDYSYTVAFTSEAFLALCRPSNINKEKTRLSNPAPLEIVSNPYCDCV